MAYLVRNTPDALTYALVKSYNLLKRDVAPLASKFHADVTSKILAGDEYTSPASTPDIITTADSTDLPTLIILITACQLAWKRHIADALAHKVADATNVLVAAVPTDLATCQTANNELKTAFNGHDDVLTWHYTADADIATANQSDLATGITLANAWKAKFNTHIQSAPAAPSLLVGPA